MIEVIAEWGQSCGGNLDTAMAQAHATREAGCAWAKFQTFHPDRLVSPNAGRYWDPTLGGFASQRATFLANGMLNDTDWRTLAEYCHSLGVGFMSSPFDLEAVDLLVAAGARAFKIASGEITHRQLLQLVAQTGLPVYLSTGAATLTEISRALDWLRPAEVTLLACTLAYPTLEGDANLGRIETLRRLYPNPVGYSDHTLRCDTSMAAVALGATVLEKHATLSSDGAVPDDKMALDPAGLRTYVKYALLGESLRGNAAVAPSDAEQAARAGARRSLHAAVNIPAGKTLQLDDFVCLRPAGPFNPADVGGLVGKTAARDIVAGQQIHPDDIH